MHMVSIPYPCRPTLTLSIGDAIRVWTMSTPQQGVYVMNKKLKIQMPTSFSNKEDELLSFLQSCWELLVR